MTLQEICDLTVFAIGLFYATVGFVAVRRSKQEADKARVAIAIATEEMRKAAIKRIEEEELRAQQLKEQRERVANNFERRRPN